MTDWGHPPPWSEDDEAAFVFDASTMIVARIDDGEMRFHEDVGRRIVDIVNASTRLLSELPRCSCAELDEDLGLGKGCTRQADGVHLVGRTRVVAECPMAHECFVRMTEACMRVHGYPGGWWQEWPMGDAIRQLSLALRPADMEPKP